MVDRANQRVVALLSRPGCALGVLSLHVRRPSVFELYPYGLTEVLKPSLVPAKGKGPCLSTQPPSPSPSSSTATARLPSSPSKLSLASASSTTRRRSGKRRVGRSGITPT